MRKILSVTLFIFILSLTTSAIAELRTTVDPMEYVVQEVMEVNDDIITLENGMIIKILLPQGDGIKIKDDKIIYFDEEGILRTVKINDYFNIQVGNHIIIGFANSWEIGDHITVKSFSNCYYLVNENGRVQGRASVELYIIKDNYVLYKVKQ
jgi:hypothetical protein